MSQYSIYSDHYEIRAHQAVSKKAVSLMRKQGNSKEGVHAMQ